MLQKDNLDKSAYYCTLGKTVKSSFKILLLVLILTFATGFYLIGFTYNITCPKCNGTGQVWDKWYDFNIQTWIQGYRACPTCGGSGKVWMYSSVSVGLMSFLAHFVCFLLFFALDWTIISFQLERNSWVKDVKKMRYWFNPAYFLWLFHTNHKKWFKWTTIIVLLGTIITVVDFALGLAPTSQTITLWLHITNQDFFVGWLIGAILLIPFSIAWYWSYEEIFKSFMYERKETPKAFLKQCVECNREIPIASEECPYCGAKQP